MKASILLIGLLSLAITISGCIEALPKQELEEYDLYYWAIGEKQLLTHPEGKVSIVMDREFELEEIRSRLQKFEKIGEIGLVPTIEHFGGGYSYSKTAFFIKHSYEDELDFVSTLRHEPNVKAADIALYAYGGGEYSHIVLTDRIAVAVKPEKESDFLNAIKSDPVAISEKKQRGEKFIYYLTVDYKRTKSNSLNLANKYYELDSTEWSSPDFIAMVSTDV